MESCAQAHTFANHTNLRTIQSLQNSVLLANARAKAKTKNVPTLSKTKTFKTGGITSHST